MKWEALVTLGDVEHEPTISDKPFITTDLVVTGINATNGDPMAIASFHSQFQDHMWEMFEWTM